MLIGSILALVSIAALAYAVRVALSLRNPPVSRDRLESAIRPAEGRAILWDAPARSYDRPGSN